MNNLKSIHTSNAPQAAGPYSQAIVANGFVFCAGQIGLDPKTGNLSVGIENQTSQALENIKAVLKEADCGFVNVVKTTIFLKNISDYATVNALYGEIFSSHKPARSTIEVSHLPKDALIEIDAVAVI